MKDQYIYTIIIPHFNTPTLLRMCLDSIPQRFDIQIIVVDDMSSKEVITELHEMELLFPQVQFIYSNQKGGGGKARNIGLKKAKGKFVLFADADDFFFTNRLSSLLDKYKEEEEIDVVYLNAKSTIEHTVMESEIQPRIRGILENKTLNVEERKNRVMFETWEPWTRMVSRDLIVNNGIWFDEISRQNDMYFGLAVSAYATHVAIEEDYFYCWRQTKSSISRKKLDENSFMDLLHIRYRLDNLYKQRNINRKVCFLYYIYLATKYYGLQFVYHKVIPFFRYNRINPFRGLRHYLMHQS